MHCQKAGIYRRGTEEAESGMTITIGDFITAELLDGKGDPRQGWVTSKNPFRIVGQTGTRYLCEGVPVLVKNPPTKTTLDLVRIYLYSQNRIIRDGEVDGLLKLMGEQRKMCGENSVAVLENMEYLELTTDESVMKACLNATGEA